MFFSCLQSYHDQQTVAMEQLSEENSSLRCRLRDVAHSPLSDNEKQQLLLDHRQHSSSAPASIAINLVDQGGDNAGTTTPDWDKQSLCSEVSVACLQDRIMQMQETHYSTNEELQATLQELSDLQAQLVELQHENERLADEKSVLLESLCRQTEKLEDSRTEADTLKQLLYEGGEPEQGAGSEREQRLVELLKGAQDEREALLQQHEQLGSQAQDARQSAASQAAEADRLRDRVRLLESTLDATHAERKQLEQELAVAREQSSSRHIEINRLATLLENARAKVTQLEQDRAADGDKCELDELLDVARREKDAVESQAAALQEQLSLCRCEVDRLRDQAASLQEECKVTRNNARCTQGELEYRCDQLSSENARLCGELQALRDAAGELQAQAQRQLDDKRQLKAVLSDSQRHCADMEQRLRDTSDELDVEKRLRQEENDEWQQFQNDLLMTVRVANDFKTEAQQELQNLLIENKTQRDKVRSLEQQLDKLKAQTGRYSFHLFIFHCNLQKIGILINTSILNIQNNSIS